tara:strand:+ start:297 stop:2117 length:1821 start_codon:yes stop_codon:yes gene_type:complete
MCGIVAQFSLNKETPNRNLIEKMNNDLHHRGPDDEGYFFSDWLSIGFKRLSVIDLSNLAHQPMMDETKSFVIAFNGELYNYKNIKKKLIKLGHNFFSNSDTEVVLKSFIEWGPSCLSKFEGMFALVIYNLSTEKVFIARDQLGIKPLYFLRDNNNILFSSEIKAFRNYTQFRLNKKKIYEQFNFRYVAGEETIFDDIYRVLPGSYFEINKNGKITNNVYYNILDSLKNSNNNKIKFNEIELKLNDSILSHTQSDVGYNIQLSGGLDSSFITAILKQRYNHHLSTFSVQLNGHKDDETIYQQYISEKFKTSHYGFPFNGNDYADNLVKATWHMDMPIIHGAGIFLMMLCEFSSENSKVILTGEGADELFGGYGRYRITKKIKFIHWLKQNGFKGDLLPSFSKLGGLKSLLNKDWGLTEQIFHNENTMNELLHIKSYKIDYRKNNIAGFNNILHKIIASDQTSYLQSLLERQDKFSMAMGVETRVPFCTHKLFETINNLNSYSKINNEPKLILKKISEQFFDKKFIYRPKVGFILPYGKWLRDKNKTGRYLDLITDDTFKNRGYYDFKKISKMVDEHLYKNIDHSKYINKFIHFEIWHRLFLDKTLTV